MKPVSMNQIQDFLRQRSIALVGLSRDPKDYTRNLFNSLKELNTYKLIPVNPNADEIDGMPSFKSVGEIAPAPDAVMIFTVKAPLENIVKECIESGISHIWINNFAKDKELKDRIEELCRKSGKNLIMDYCPFMFLQDSGFIHKFHGFCLKVTGKYPQKKQELVG